MTVDRITAMELPDGSKIKIECHEGGNTYPDGEETRWKSIEIVLARNDGYEEEICAIDYEDSKPLRVLVYDSEYDEPVFTKAMKL